MVDTVQQDGTLQIAVLRIAERIHSYGDLYVDYFLASARNLLITNEWVIIVEKISGYNLVNSSAIDSQLRWLTSSTVVIQSFGIT